MADIDWVVKRSRRIEALLKQHYHAEGKGLHELITSCEERLPHDLIPQLRFIATIRNKTVHEDGFKLDNRADFAATCKQCEQVLTPRSGRFVWGLAMFLVFGLTALAALFYYLVWDKISLAWLAVSSSNLC
ncbi:DUF4145 domain-containing protein [Thaumasiovibrio subtropicus]|uniref:DUF4145 domain-containing protein n=1 Tax=Thaumasiovibrio subtropicus TaxID=1891207 RepID=UPI000B35BD8B|nr:DUF4145 domain-containing protein [Thaumasiovibrio subtropicus]